MKLPFPPMGWVGPSLKIKHNPRYLRSHVHLIETEFSAHLQHGRGSDQHIAKHATETFFLRVVNDVLRWRHAQRYLRTRTGPTAAVWSRGTTAGPSLPSMTTSSSTAT